MCSVEGKAEVNNFPFSLFCCRQFPFFTCFYFLKELNCPWENIFILVPSTALEPAIWYENLIVNNEKQVFVCVIVCANATLRFIYEIELKRIGNGHYFMLHNIASQQFSLATFPIFSFQAPLWFVSGFEILSFLMRFSLLIFIRLLLLSYTSAFF